MESEDDDEDEDGMFQTEPASPEVKRERLERNRLSLNRLKEEGFIEDSPIKDGTLEARDGLLLNGDPGKQDTAAKEEATPIKMIQYDMEVSNESPHSLDQPSSISSPPPSSSSPSAHTDPRSSVDSSMTGTVPVPHLPNVNKGTAPAARNDPKVPAKDAEQAPALATVGKVRRKTPIKLARSAMGAALSGPDPSRPVKSSRTSQSSVTGSAESSAELVDSNNVNRGGRSLIEWLLAMGVEEAKATSVAQTAAQAGMSDEQVLELVINDRQRARTTKPENGQASDAALAKCAVCGKSPAPARCSQCKARYYCSRECQIVDWKGGHKQSCTGAKSNKDRAAGSSQTAGTGSEKAALPGGAKMVEVVVPAGLKVGQKWAVEVDGQRLAKPTMLADMVPGQYIQVPVGFGMKVAALQGTDGTTTPEDPSQEGASEASTNTATSPPSSIQVLKAAIATEKDKIRKMRELKVDEGMIEPQVHKVQELQTELKTAQEAAGVGFTEAPMDGLDEAVSARDTTMSWDTVTISVPVERGSLGVSFDNFMVPPTLLRFTGDQSPLYGQVTPNSKLVEFNGQDTTQWTMTDLKSGLGAAAQDRVFTFQVPVDLKSSTTLDQKENGGENAVKTSWNTVTISVPVERGSLGVSFDNFMVPPTLLRLTSDQSPLYGKVKPNSKLVEFNGQDTTQWTMADLKSGLGAATQDRVFTFKVPVDQEPSNTAQRATGNGTAASNREPLPIKSAPSHPDNMTDSDRAFDAGSGSADVKEYNDVNDETMPSNTDASRSRVGHSAEDGSSAKKSRSHSTSFLKTRKSISLTVRRGSNRRASETANVTDAKTYRCVLTIQRVLGLPPSWTKATLQHPVTDADLELDVIDGMAHVNRGIAFHRTFASTTPGATDMKFRLLNFKGKKVGKAHCNLEQMMFRMGRGKLVQMCHMVDLQGTSDVKDTKIQFRIAFVELDGSSKFRKDYVSDHLGTFDRVEITMAPGSLGASIANGLMPPTIAKMVDLPDGEKSPLEGRVTSRAELIQFNNYDTWDWDVNTLSSQLTLTQGDAEWRMVFNVPRGHDTKSEFTAIFESTPASKADQAALQDITPDQHSFEDDPEPSQEEPTDRTIQVDEKRDVHAADDQVLATTSWDTVTISVPVERGSLGVSFDNFMVPPTLLRLTSDQSPLYGQVKPNSKLVEFNGQDTTQWTMADLKSGLGAATQDRVFTFQVPAEPKPSDAPFQKPPPSASRSAPAVNQGPSTVNPAGDSTVLPNEHVAAAPVTMTPRGQTDFSQSQPVQARAKAFHSDDETVKWKEVSVDVPKGPLRASFHTSIVPPTLVRLVHGKKAQSPLTGYVTPGAQLTSFNDHDTSLWNAQDLQNHYKGAQDAEHRLLTFRAPVQTATPESEESQAEPAVSVQDEASMAEPNATEWAIKVRDLERKNTQLEEQIKALENQKAQQPSSSTLVVSDHTKERISIDAVRQELGAHLQGFSFGSVLSRPLLDDAMQRLCDPDSSSAGDLSAGDTYQYVSDQVKDHILSLVWQEVNGRARQSAGDVMDHGSETETQPNSSAKKSASIKSDQAKDGGDVGDERTGAGAVADDLEFDDDDLDFDPDGSLGTTSDSDLDSSEDEDSEADTQHRPAEDAELALAVVGKVRRTPRRTVLSVPLKLGNVSPSPGPPSSVSSDIGSLNLSVVSGVTNEQTPRGAQSIDYVEEARRISIASSSRPNLSPLSLPLKRDTSSVSSVDYLSDSDDEANTSRSWLPQGQLLDTALQVSRQVGLLHDSLDRLDKQLQSLATSRPPSAPTAQPTEEDRVRMLEEFRAAHLWADPLTDSFVEDVDEALQATHDRGGAARRSEERQRKTSNESDGLIRIQIEGPMYAGFSKGSVPPRIFRLHSKPNGTDGPLEGRVPTNSEVVELDGVDTTKWSVADLKAAWSKSGPHHIVFKAPSFESSMMTTPSPPQESRADTARRLAQEMLCQVELAAETSLGIQGLRVAEKLSHSLVQDALKNAEHSVMQWHRMDQLSDVKSGQSVEDSTTMGPAQAQAPAQEHVHAENGEATDDRADADHGMDREKNSPTVREINRSFKGIFRRSACQVDGTENFEDLLMSVRIPWSSDYPLHIPQQHRNVTLTAEASSKRAPAPRFRFFITLQRISGLPPVFHQSATHLGHGSDKPLAQVSLTQSVTNETVLLDVHQGVAIINRGLVVERAFWDPKDKSADVKFRVATVHGNKAKVAKLHFNLEVARQRIVSGDAIDTRIMSMEAEDGSSGVLMHIKVLFCPLDETHSHSPPVSFMSAPLYSRVTVRAQNGVSLGASFARELMPPTILHLSSESAWAKGVLVSPSGALVGEVTAMSELVAYNGEDATMWSGSTLAERLTEASGVNGHLLEFEVPSPSNKTVAGSADDDPVNQSAVNPPKSGKGSNAFRRSISRTVSRTKQQSRRQSRTTVPRSRTSLVSGLLSPRRQSSTLLKAYEFVLTVRMLTGIPPGVDEVHLECPGPGTPIKLQAVHGIARLSAPRDVSIQASFGASGVPAKMNPKFRVTDAKGDKIAKVYIDLESHRRSVDANEGYHAACSMVSTHPQVAINLHLKVICQPISHQAGKPMLVRTTELPQLVYDEVKVRVAPGPLGISFNPVLSPPMVVGVSGPLFKDAMGNPDVEVVPGAELVLLDGEEMHMYTGEQIAAFENRIATTGCSLVFTVPRAQSLGVAAASLGRDGLSEDGLEDYSEEREDDEEETSPLPTPSSTDTTSEAVTMCPLGFRCSNYLLHKEYVAAANGDMVAQMCIVMKGLSEQENVKLDALVGQTESPEQQQAVMERLMAMGVSERKEYIARATLDPLWDLMMGLDDREISTLEKMFVGSTKPEAKAVVDMLKGKSLAERKQFLADLWNQKNAVVKQQAVLDGFRRSSSVTSASTDEQVRAAFDAAQAGAEQTTTRRAPVLEGYRRSNRLLGSWDKHDNVSHACLKYLAEEDALEISHLETSMDGLDTEEIGRLEQIVAELSTIEGREVLRHLAQMSIQERKAALSGTGTQRSPVEAVTEGMTKWEKERLEALMIGPNGSIEEDFINDLLKLDLRERKEFVSKLDSDNLEMCMQGLTEEECEQLGRLTSVADDMQLERTLDMLSIMSVSERKSALAKMDMWLKPASSSSRASGKNTKAPDKTPEQTSRKTERKGTPPDAAVHHQERLPLLPNGEEVIFEQVTVTVPVGPLGASFSNKLSPPTIIDRVRLPDGSNGPLPDTILPRSQLVRFNGLDAVEWTLHDLKRQLAATEHDTDRTLVFDVPRLNSDRGEKQPAASSPPRPVPRKRSPSPSPEKAERRERNRRNMRRVSDAMSRQDQTGSLRLPGPGSPARSRSRSPSLPSTGTRMLGETGRQRSRSHDGFTSNFDDEDAEGGPDGAPELVLPTVVGFRKKALLVSQDTGAADRFKQAIVRTRSMESDDGKKPEEVFTPRTMPPEEVFTPRTMSTEEDQEYLPHLDRTLTPRTRVKVEKRKTREKKRKSSARRFLRQWSAPRDSDDDVEI